MILILETRLQNCVRCISWRGDKKMGG